MASLGNNYDFSSIIKMTENGMQLLFFSNMVESEKFDKLQSRGTPSCDSRVQHLSGMLCNDFWFE